MRESAYREREGSPAVRFKEPLYDNYVPPGVAVRQKSDQTKKSAQPAAAKGRFIVLLLIYRQIS
jgi:hypothetical protein